MTYDYVIVGAGSAGCVLANRLSADPAQRVLAARSGRARLASVHPYAGGPRQARQQQAHQLGLLHRARAAARRSPALVAARQGARRIEFDQRDVLYPRRSRATTTTGRSDRRCALGTGTRCCRISSAPKATRAAPTRGTARRPAVGADLRYHNALSDVVHRRRRRPQASAQPRFQRRDAGRLRLLPGHAEETARAARRGRAISRRRGTPEPDACSRDALTDARARSTAIARSASTIGHRGRPTRRSAAT